MSTGSAQLVLVCLQSVFFALPLNSGPSNAPVTSIIMSLTVKWNFVGNGKKQLSLEVGDAVQIQEVCDGKNMTHYKNGR